MEYTEKTAKLLARMEKVALRQEYVFDKEKITELVEKSYKMFGLDVPKIEWCIDITDEKFLRATWVAGAAWAAGAAGVAGAAVGEAAWVAAWVAARNAERKWQVEQLRKMLKKALFDAAADMAQHETEKGRNETIARAEKAEAEVERLWKCLRELTVELHSEGVPDAEEE